MIAIARGFNIGELSDKIRIPYELGSPSKPLSLDQSLGDTPDSSTQLRDWLYFYKTQLKELKSPDYNAFVDLAVELAPEYLKSDFNLEPCLEICDEPQDQFVGVTAIFPSQRNYPFAEFYPYHRRVGYPYDPASAYSILINSIRIGGFLTEHDRNFVDNLARRLKKSGRIDGQKVVKRADVEFVKGIAQEFLER